MYINISKEQQALDNIKKIVDAFYAGRITITVGNNDFGIDSKYDINSIIGVISNHTYAGLGLPIPEHYTITDGD